jgi:hypothetical protein
MWEWRVREGRPRIWLDESRLALLRDKTRGMDLAAVKNMVGGAALGKALTYVLTGDEESARNAISLAMAYSEKNGWAYMRSLAACYDWCYPVLSAEERAEFRALFVREGLKRLSMPGVWRSFHHRMYTEAGNLGFCALALESDDHFARTFLEFLKTRYRDAMRVLDDVFPDGEWSEGFDLNREATGWAIRFFWALKTATGDDLMAQSPHIRNTIQYIIHCAKPDGLVYPGGDNDYPYLNDRDREMLLMLAAEFRDPYAQYFLNRCKVKTFVQNKGFAWQDALWYDASIPERPLDDIPRSRIFRGHGLVVARSAWGWDEEQTRLPASWVTFRCGKYFGRGSHYDNNHFEIYCKGELAIDSGRDDDDWGLEKSPDAVRRSQFFNYYRRSIAHNTILVEQPEEQMEMGVVNDGGQKELLYADGVLNEPENFDMKEYLLDEKRMCHDWAATQDRWDTGEMLAYTGNNLFTYACGDATKSYSPVKMEYFTRQFLYVQGDLVIVFDRVVAVGSMLRKTWLLHSIVAPRVRRDGTFEIEHNGGRLVCVPVLPEQRSVEKIGGAGKEFLVGEHRYACGPHASSGHRAPLHFGELPGAWRIEESPLVPSEEDYFLNIILMTDRESKLTPKVTRLGEDAITFGVRVVLPRQRSVTASFLRGPKPGASLLIEDRGRLLFDGTMPDRVVMEKGRL